MPIYPQPWCAKWTPGYDALGDFIDPWVPLLEENSKVDGKTEDADNMTHV